MISGPQKAPISKRREEWLPLLVMSVREVFDIMAGSKLVPVFDAADPAKLDFTAMVGLAGQLCGVLTFRCDEGSATKIASKLLGVDPKDAEPHAWDAVGEICNMIAGNFKNKISGMSDRCVLSAPTVIVGTQYKIHPLAVESIRATFVFDGAPVCVDLELRV